MTDQPPSRVVIHHVKPEVDCGRFPIKRVIGEVVEIEADIFADGHDSIACVIRYRHEDDEVWAEIDRKSTRLNSSHSQISYAVFCLKKKTTKPRAPMKPSIRFFPKTNPPIGTLTSSFERLSISAKA